MYVYNVCIYAARATMWVTVCLCVCVCVPVCVSVCVFRYIRGTRYNVGQCPQHLANVCVCVCVRARARR